jgi:hypothetical protein
MINYNDQKKSNKKFQSDEKDFIINDHNLNLHLDPDNYSYKEEESFEEGNFHFNPVHHGDHKDFTSSDLKEDEIIPIDPKLVITNSVSDRRTNRNNNPPENDNKVVGRIKFPQEDVDLDISDNMSDDKINL